MSWVQAVVADLAFESWSRHWILLNQDVICRRCFRRQRLISADEAFAHRSLCPGAFGSTSHHPWRDLADILKGIS